jgi:CRP-like cAMP-binding protein
MRSFCLRIKWMYSVRCITDCEVIYLNKDELINRSCSHKDLYKLWSELMRSIRSRLSIRIYILSYDKKQRDMAILVSAQINAVNIFRETVSIEDKVSDSVDDD